MTPRRARIADVAERAGVSTTAVSFVFSGKDSGNVAPATRERIIEAARELGYRPNRVAQSLRQSRTHAVGLITDGIASSPFAGRLVAAAGQRLAELGHALIVYDSDFHADREQAAVDELGSRRVDAVVYATMGLRLIETTPRTPLPIVLANCFQEPDVLPTAVPDDVRVGRDAAELLVRLGHTRIAMLSGPDPEPRWGWEWGNVAGPMRASGFRAALGGAGLDPAPAAVHVCGWDIDDGHAGALRVLTDGRGRLLAADVRPTALFAINDRVALGALLAAISLGLEVPGDLSIVGVDDQEALAAHLVPALTTFRLPHAAMGEWAVETALDLTEAPAPTGDVPERVLFPLELIERGTSSPPR